MLDSTFFDSWQQLAIVCLVLVVAEAIYVAFGFGAGLIAVGALAIVVPSLPDVVVMVFLVNLPIELWVIARSHSIVRWHGVLLLATGVAVGVPIGARLLSVAAPVVVLGLLGAVLVMAGLAFLTLADGFRVRWPRAAAPAVGLSSGLLSGLFGTGGPPLILYYQLSGVAKAEFRGSIMAIFLLVDLIRLPAYVYEGLVTAPRVGASLAVLPAVVGGAVLGSKIHLELSEVTFRRIVSLIVAAIGVLLLVRAGLDSG